MHLAINSAISTGGVYLYGGTSLCRNLLCENTSPLLTVVVVARLFCFPLISLDPTSLKQPLPIQDYGHRWRPTWIISVQINPSQTDKWLQAGVTAEEGRPAHQALLGSIVSTTVRPRQGLWRVVHQWTHGSSSWSTFPSLEA